MYPMIAITGSESSGTRLVQRLCEQATGWKANDMEALWAGVPTEAEGPLITRHSQPHGAIGLGRWFFKTSILEEAARASGWEPVYLLTTRDRTCTLRSKAENHTQGDTILALAELQECERLLQEHLSLGLPTRVISLESIIAIGPDRVVRALVSLGITPFPDPDFEDVIDSNARHFGAHA